MKVKSYLSDEGFGHIVRQRAIILELKKLIPGINITIQTEKHIDFASKNIEAHHYIRKFNNIIWHKNEDSSPNLAQIESYYANYLERTQQFPALEKREYDFIISDFVYEAFDYAQYVQVPSFGVSHFTWDWFFSKLYPPPLSRKVLRYFFKQAESATTLFFPPLTPQEIISHYKKNALQVPFIVRNDIKNYTWPCEPNKFKILIIDSGAQLMKEAITKVLNQFQKVEDLFFGSPYKIDNENCFQVPSDQLLVDYVRGADLVIGRPGFNTISECIAMRIPMLLISEAMNPEMEHNISELKKRRLGAFMSVADFQYRFSDFLSDFLDHEYENLKRNMKLHSFATDGAFRVAKEILNRL